MQVVSQERMGRRQLMHNVSGAVNQGQSLVPSPISASDSVMSSTGWTTGCNSGNGVSSIG